MAGILIIGNIIVDTVIFRRLFGLRFRFRRSRTLGRRLAFGGRLGAVLVLALGRGGRLRRRLGAVSLVLALDVVLVVLGGAGQGLYRVGLGGALDLGEIRLLFAGALAVRAFALRGSGSFAAAGRFALGGAFGTRFTLRLLVGGRFLFGLARSGSVGFRVRLSAGGDTSPSVSGTTVTVNGVPAASSSGSASAAAAPSIPKVLAKTDNASIIATIRFFIMMNSFLPS